MKLTVQKLSLYLLTGFCLGLDTSCTEGNTQVKIPQLSVTAASAVPPVPAPIAIGPKANAAAIIARTEVPILCYHQVRDYKPTDGNVGRPYIVPVAVFREQMKVLADSGYHTILPDQLVEYLETGKALPSKPVMITFDDTRLDQYTAALPALDQHGFKGAFFIMTVSLGRPGYMSKEQVKDLSDRGHTIGSHTWDHKNVKKYVDEDWPVQVEKPSKQLQTITGKPVEYFAYPFGLWNKQAIAGLKRFHFKAVFQLADNRDEQDPMYSVRRIIVPGSWSGQAMLKSMRNSF
jgi:peptidoglycan/xylan/chitin deacetylase (PgdA/CDA1 family)